MWWKFANLEANNGRNPQTWRWFKLTDRFVENVSLLTLTGAVPTHEGFTELFT